MSRITGGSARPLGSLFTTLLVLASACASASNRQEPVIPGCYYFERTGAANELNLPWGVRLEDAALEGWPAMEQRGGMRAVTLTGSGEADHPFGYWISTAPDSVEVGYPAGGGLVLELEVGEDRDLSGVAIPVGDIVDPNDPSPRDRHQVTLSWARCP